MAPPTVSATNAITRSRAALADRRVELAREPRAVGFGALAGALVAVRVARRDVLHVDQERRELSPPPRVAADRERAERVAVIALPPRDEDAALRLADLDEILPRHLERGLDRFRAAAHEVGVARAGGRRADEPVGERLRRLGREEARVRVREPVDLRMHRRQHIGVAVAEARHGGAARRVEILLARGVGEIDAATRDGDGRRRAQIAVEDVRHREIAGDAKAGDGARVCYPCARPRPSRAMIAAQKRGKEEA